MPQGNEKAKEWTIQRASGRTKVRIIMHTTRNTSVTTTF